MGGQTLLRRSPAAAHASRPVRLDDRYLLPEGRVFISGVQALVRLLLDQHRADSRAGLRTASMVSGYQGSPLGGFDKEVARLGALADEHDLVLRPAVNEELGATAVWGSQLAATLPRPRYDGVLGVWYGKAPGVDRSADAIRHGNFVGAAPRGGVLALVGDDPACKSSTIPGASEGLLAALQVPVLVPGSVQEALDLGRHAIACSRASGLWAALKVVTNVADATATVDVGLDRVEPVMPQLAWEGAPYVHRPSAHLLAPQSLEMERTLVEVRLPLAKRYAQLNGLNPLVRDDRDARLGIVAAGATCHDLLRALDDLGADPGSLPLRILKLGMVFPLDEQAVRSFADGLDEVLVVEEKGPFLERLVKEALYGAPAAPRVLGQRDERGAALVPAAGVLDADAIARAIGPALLRRAELPAARARLEELEAIAGRAEASLGARRTPFYCSGCPHNASTVADDDALVGAGIGCHTMVLLNPAKHGNVSGITQMGGEGAQWIGAAPFLERRHFVQNLGDGTFHHSGSLAVRAAVAAKLDVTFKLLYNGTVAMTGGQDVEGQLSVERLVRSLTAEGVARIVVTTEETGRYRDVALPEGVEVRDRSRLLETQRELAAVPGVTVLIHDQACAAELRRARKRGKAPEPPQQVQINERVCEGCGDCGEKSGCLSVEPVETELGRKTRIHQASCNKDLSCLEGDCPSFLTIIPPRAAAPPPAPPAPPEGMPEPELRPADEAARVRLVGIGGTGVVTVSQVLGMAALLDGREAGGLDQTGLSQKAGPVVSDVRIGGADGGATASAGRADLLLALDLLGAGAARNLRVADPERTVAVVSTSVVPTGEMVTDPRAAAPDVGAARAAIDAVTRAEENVYLDAQALSQRLFGDHLPANMLVLGAAWQRGALPLSREALHDALRLNGAGADANRAAFEWGRACVAAPEAVERIVRGEAAGDGAATAGGGTDAAALAALPSAPGATAPPSQPSRRARELAARAAGGDEELERLVALRADDLERWGGRQAAIRYTEAVARVRAAEQERLPDGGELTAEVARGLHKLIAYKDEYEVARLHVEGVRELPRGTRVAFHLHPPLLRALGMRRKLRLGGWFLPALRLLRHGRRLRGTPLDPFGYAHVRRVERQLPEEYLGHVDAALARLTPATRATAVEIARLPELVRGYEEIKLAGVERFRARARELAESIEQTTAEEAAA
ncbi:indolepyruvate ferredoxin oxidoreductase family protein [Conexibacter arvalis]|uniref:Indolepyruvate ferredoxin oxidoreductase n=1 Tax=Conexibacter arvalis TaxID=912552 RepID=A0A840ILJ6_9ACTN|nr:indolepyruvate ferredoxin oxidoreductase family protein [Conexibacter arvalis]MBB4665121.1 indolepyruvate ferredoxin oxidoreductase [Conexibacter arvalis]